MQRGKNDREKSVSRQHFVIRTVDTRYFTVSSTRDKTKDRRLQDVWYGIPWNL